ncbi:transcription factor HES-4-like [Mantella aurantiaca]
MRNTYLSKEDKKLMKPVIEKRRRDRINQSLEHLRTLLLEATHDESLKNPKAEKADILKKTVQFLKLCHNPGPEEAKKPSGFKGGFQEGLSQAATFLNSTETICERKRDYVVGKLCQHMEEKSPNNWEDSASDESFTVDHSQLLPSPPQIPRLLEDHLAMHLENSPCQPFLHHPSPSSSSEAPSFGQTQRSTTHTAQANSCRKPVQRTLFPPTAPTPPLAPTLVWRPWP